MPNPQRYPRRALDQPSLKSPFFTDDYFNHLRLHRDGILYHYFVSVQRAFSTMYPQPNNTLNVFTLGGMANHHRFRTHGVPNLFPALGLSQMQTMSLAPKGSFDENCAPRPIFDGGLHAVAGHYHAVLFQAGTWVDRGCLLFLF